MQMKKMLQKKRCLSLKTFAVAVLMVFFAMPAKAQTNVVKMGNGSVTVLSTGSIRFYDSGGADLVEDPNVDPNDINWMSWYQHGEDYKMTFNPADNSKGIKFSFDYLRVNNDFIRFYEGDEVNNNNLIAEFTNQDYFNNPDGVVVMSHGTVTVWFKSDARYRDRGWAATVELVDWSDENFKPSSPAIMMSACDNSFRILPTSKGNSTTKIYYTLAENNGTPADPTNASTEYVLGDNETLINGESMTFPVTLKAIAYIDDEASNVVTQKFNKITNPDFDETYYEHNETQNTIDVETRKPEGIMDTYYVRYIFSASQDPGDPAFWSQTDYREIENPGGTIDYTNPGLTARPFYVHMVIRGTVCPENFSPVETVEVENVYAPKPEIVFASTGDTIKCGLQGADIYYTTNGADPDENSAHQTVTALTNSNNEVLYYYIIINHVSPGVSVKAMTVKNGYENSEIAYAVYSEGSGVYPGSGIVFLDDREDHSWSYYSDPTSPIRSLNPADVKISYFGNGNTVSTSNDNNPATSTFTASTNNSVQVSASESGNQFIYLMTLERKGGDVATSMEASTGRCPYVTIANPFTKRPTYGTGDTRWRGFYGWRVKTVRGGSIYTVATGGTALATNAIVNADTQLYFAPDSPKGMEVEFEALWARAYVTDATTNGANNVGNYTVGYERNFLVLATNNAYYMGANAGNNRRITNTNNRDVTITSTYPDGTTPANRGQFRVYGTITLGYNMKIENVTINAYGQNGDIVANGFYLHIGRGLNTNNNLCYRLIGSSGSQKNHDFTIRAESGLIRSVYLTNGGVPSNYRFYCNLIFGCDYDRASNANGRLLVAPNEQIVFGQGMINGVINKSARTLDCVVKSGTFQSGYQNTNNEVGQNTHSIYIGSTNGHNETGYAGKRYITVEGGEIANIAGGRGPMEADYAPVVTDTVVTVRIKGGRVHGSVYGGASSSTSYGSRKIVITGGEVQGWVATGCNSTSVGYGGVTSGTGNIYIGGNAVIGGSSPRTINGTVGGNVFGAGHGKDTENAASMSATCVVIADNADILHNVYGGGNYGYVYPTGQDAYDGEHKADVRILGGIVHDNVFGGANMNEGQHVYITMNGGEVQGSVYGGSNTFGKIHEDATITINNGLVNGSVFGGGYGGTYADNSHDYVGTVMAKNTIVNVNGGTINNNVYGGGQLGIVTQNTNVNISGGTMNDVFGAGLGTPPSPNTNPTLGANANIGQNTNVTVTGGTMQNVFGGGENGSVAYTNGGAPTYASTVNVSGGVVNVNVYGGGSMGFSQANTFVNVSGNAMVMGDVFGGALGKRQIVFVGGVRTVNMTGGTVSGSVYGGSKNADDALRLTNYQNTNYYSQAANRVNITGGHVVYQVFAAGFFGNTYGSVYAFIGKNAVLNAPNHMTIAAPYDATFFTPQAALNIEENVWAGGDFGSFDGTAFGQETVEGYSNIYVDGTDYDTESHNTGATNYMNIGKSLFGCGTSCYAGKLGRDIYVRNYGKAVENSAWTGPVEFEVLPIVEPYLMASRSFYSIQFANNLIIDNSNINLLGQGRVNSLVSTEHFSLYDFPTIVRVTNASGLFLYAPADQIKKFGSYTCPDLYADSPTYTVVNYTDLPTTGMDNKIRVNGGSFINVYYTNAYGQGMSYGELEGFFYMMTEDQNLTCAYARPKTGGYNNWTGNDQDGGFVSYNEYNIFNVAGVEIGSGGIQMAYENHTTNLNAKSGEQYFRIWRYGGIYSYREGVLNAIGSTTEGYSIARCTINLPASSGAGSYYKFKNVDNTGFTGINYGTDVLTVNAGCYGNTSDNDWMYFAGEDLEGQYVIGQGSTQTNVKEGLDYIDLNPNANFGLVALPQGALASDDNENWLICEEADVYNATLARWDVANTTGTPTMEFLLTYNNNITANMTWDPITIVVQQWTADGQLEDEVEIQLTVITSTTIDQEFTTQVYATMRGNGTAYDSYTAKVVLPEYTLFVDQAGSPSTWSYVEYDWIPEEGFEESAFKAETGYYVPEHSNTDFSMTMAPSTNFDYSMGWDHWDETAKDIYNLDDGYEFGYVLARNPFAFDFTIHYDGNAVCHDRVKMGTLRVKLLFTNYKNAGAANNYEQYSYINVEVYRVGMGANWFLDGVNGNHFYSGHYPNAAKKTLARILTDPEYMPGDNIFVVNTVTNNSGTLDWNGESKGGVTVYRYPGGHELWPSTDNKEAYQGWSTYNPDNTGFQGVLLQVNSDMKMHGITLDGAYQIVHPDQFDPEAEIDENKVPDPTKYLAPNSPLVVIESGGVLSMYGNSVMQWNFSTEDGGAVYNNGTMNVYGGSVIEHNATIGKDGGGVYLAENANLQLSDLVTIYNNWSNIPTVSEGVITGTDNNVYLATAASELLIGTVNPQDLFVSLNDGSKIGVTKGEWGQYYYTPVAYADGGYDDYLDNIMQYSLITDDEHYYELVSLNNTHFGDQSTYHLYFVDTWVTFVREKPADFDPEDIDTPEELAWAISVATGYNGVNDGAGYPSTTFKVTADIDMNAHIWVPIGSKSNPYLGKFEGNGHVITGLRSPLNSENMGMFGTTNNAEIGDFVARAKFVGGTMKNIGAIIGSMNGGTLSNVEAAGTLTGTKSTVNMGGLVGETKGETFIHSCFAVDTLNGGINSKIGGLVGDNVADLYNSYSNVTITGGNLIGGLVGNNSGHVENCYNITDVQYVFAGTNDGVILYCYAVDGTDEDNYVGAESSNQPVGHGTYGPVKGRKEIGYLYDDNAVTVAEGQTNTYVATTLTYKNIGGGGADNTNEATRHRVIDKWPGLLSTLNQWVEDRNATTDQSSVYFGKNFTDWSRTSSSYLDEGSVNAYINGDLPVLDFPMDNCFATLDGKYLQYSATEYDENLANDDNNGIDALLAIYNAKAETSYIYLYNNATNVADYPKDNVNVFINEKAVLIQHYEEGNEGGKEGEEDENIANFKAVVGVTFENSEGTAGNTATPNCAPQVHYTDDPLDLLYDWHMMSSPLKDAPMGTVYNMEADMGFYEPANITSMVDNYLPNGLSMTTPAPEDAVKWDLYSFYEPHYHWINLKRSTNNHWHYDINNTAPCDHDPIPYPNDEVFEPAKGYMMAISTESYLSSTGKLNNGKVTIPLTHQSLLTDIEEYGCNLIGNPFHAYLDMNKFLAKNQGFTDYYVYSAEWNHYVPNNGDASDNPAVPSRVLAPFQAFFVKVAADGEAVFNNGMTTTKPAAYSHFREEHLNYPLVNLFVTDTNGMRDLTVIEFNRPEEGGTDKLRVMDASNFELYARYNDKDYSILFTKEGTQRVPVWFKTSESGVYTMTWETYHGNFSSLRLVDNLTGVNYDMLSNNSYTFEASAGDYASRFYITFACTGVDEEEVVESEGNFAFFNGSEWVINGKGQLEVIDMLGRILYAERLTNDQNRVHLDFAPGVYMIRVVDNKNMKTQKVIVR